MEATNLDSIFLVKSFDNPLGRTDVKDNIKIDLWLGVIRLCRLDLTV
jgi:hypothetical protein